MLATGAAGWTWAAGSWTIGRSASPPSQSAHHWCVFGYCLSWPGQPTGAWPPANWEFAVCDVGQGDALLLHTGPNQAVAVDTGPDPGREDACLRRFQISALPLVVLTHFHADHIGGLPGLLSGRSVGGIETTDTDVPPAGAREVRAEAAAAGIPVRRVTPGEQRRFGPVSWQVLWPDGSAPPPDSGPDDALMNRMPGMGTGSPDADGSGPNNTSIVMAVSVAEPAGRLAILLTGDIEAPVQQALLDGPWRAKLRADVLKVPHHGSANQAPGFVEAVDPSVTVISVGRGNPYHQPAPRTVRLMGSGGARLYRTDLDGDVAVSLARSGAAVSVAAQHGDGVDPASPSASGVPERSAGSGFPHDTDNGTQYGDSGGYRDSGGFGGNESSPHGRRSRFRSRERHFDE